MRSVSPVVQALLASESVSVFVLVTLGFSTGTLRHCNLPYDVTVAGLGTFSADNGLKSIDSPSLSNVVDREIYKIVYVDTGMSLMTQLQDNAAGAPCTVYFGFINTTDANLGGATPGRPILNVAHMITAYRGIVDTYGYTIDDDGEILVTIDCASPMADLDMKRTLMSTDSMQRGRHPNDWCFRDLHVGSTQVELLWGKV